MSPVAADGRWYPPSTSDPAKGVASQTVTTTGVSAAVPADDVHAIEATLAVTAASGTSPTLNVTLETTLDGTNWYTVGSIPQQTAAATIGQVLGGNIGSQIRWRWTVGGTSPSFTFSISAATRRVGGQ